MSDGAGVFQPGSMVAELVMSMAPVIGGALVQWASYPAVHLAALAFGVLGAGFLLRVRKSN